MTKMHSKLAIPGDPKFIRSLILCKLALYNTNRLNHSTFWLALLAFAYLLSAGDTAGANDPIVIDNNPRAEVTSGVVAPIIGVRPMASADASSRNELPNFQFSKDLILRSAMEFPEVRRAAERAGLDIKDLNLPKLKELLANSEYGDNYLFSERKISSVDDLSGKKINIAPVVSELATDPKYSVWDPTIVINMFATGVLDIDSADTIATDRGLVEVVRFDAKYSDKIGHIYYALPTIVRQDKQNAALHLAGILDDIRQYQSLEQSLLKRLGRITFGKPVVYTASERELQMPESIEQDYDVYWVEFAITIWDVNMEDVDEIVVNYALPEGYLALRLIPLAYGPEVDVQKKGSTPDFSVGFGGASVSVGEAFSRSVSYSYLKPTVIAFGEGQQTFAWSMSDEAVRLGTHRFAAVVGAPKRSLNLELAMSAHLDVRRSWWNGDRSLAGTEAVVMQISF